MRYYLFLLEKFIIRFYFQSENPRADLKSNSFCCRRKIWPPAIAAFSVQMGMAIIWSAAMNKWYYASFEKTVVVYDLYQNRQSMDAIEVVFLSDIQNYEGNTVLKYCIDRDIEVLVIPRIGDVIMSGARPIHIFHLRYCT